MVELDQKISDILRFVFKSKAHCLDSSDFCPSSNWHHAMAAAERSGLLGDLIITNQSHNRWSVSKMTQDGKPGIFETDETGPLAICRAVLALASSR